MRDLPNQTPEDILGVTFEEFVALFDEIDGKKKAVDEANGSLRSLIKAKLEAKKWNKTGLAMIRQLKAMSPTQRADVIRTFKPMFELMMDRSWRSELDDLASGGDED